MSDHEAIIVRGARVNNLKNVNFTIPLNSLTVVTGVSGSGKSSLAFDTVYAEGQRRYVESLSAYARQFLERMDKPDVDEVLGICPAIAINQKNSTRNPRSTVATQTEIYDYLRLLYARVGATYCRRCGNRVSRDTPSPSSVPRSSIATPTCRSAVDAYATHPLVIVLCHRITSRRTARSCPRDARCRASRWLTDGSAIASTASAPITITASTAATGARIVMPPWCHAAPAAARKEAVSSG